MTHERTHKLREVKITNKMNANNGPEWVRVCMGECVRIRVHINLRLYEANDKAVCSQKLLKSVCIHFRVMWVNVSPAWFVCDQPLPLLMAQSSCCQQLFGDLPAAPSSNLCLVIVNNSH